MRLPASKRGRWTLAVAILALLLLAFNLWWILVNRQGFPLNVDENGYTSIAVNDYLGLRGSGPHGWWEAVQSQTPNAPLLPAITSLAMLVKPGVMAGFAVLTCFLALLVLAAYGIGERLAGPRLGALAALLVGTSEGAVLFTREYVFALPTAALLSCAVYALLRSERMGDRWWAIGCGVALGLMVLARTMAVAFVPGVFVAALALILARERSGLRKRFLNLGLAALTAVLVAATWYFHNLQPVLDYLTSYGYGAQSNYYGAQHAVVSWGRFRAVATQMIHDDLLVPLTALVLIGLIALAFLAVRRVVEATDRREALMRVLGAEAFAVTIVVAIGFAALMTSRNGGNGFTFPLAVLLPPLAILALRFFQAAVAPVAILAATIAALNLAVTSNLWDGLSRERTVDVPAFGYQPWLSGIPRAVGAIRVQVQGPTTHFDQRDKGWTESDERLAAELQRRIDAGVVSPVVAFASRNRAISSNSVGLASLLHQHNAIPFVQLNAEPADTVRVYASQLGDPSLGPPGLLVTMDRNTDDFPPLVTQSKAEAAARMRGFRRIWATSLPDGRQLRLWARELPREPG